MLIQRYLPISLRDVLEAKNEDREAAAFSLLRAMKCLKMEEFYMCDHFDNIRFDRFFHFRIYNFLAIYPQNEESFLAYKKIFPARHSCPQPIIESHLCETVGRILTGNKDVKLFLNYLKTLTYSHMGTYEERVVRVLVEMSGVGDVGVFHLMLEMCVFTLNEM